jgi:hypothetical protein
VSVFAFLNVDEPWVAWLVYRGEMVTLPTVSQEVLSLWHAKYLIDSARSGPRLPYYRTELEIERERRKSFPQRVSRLSGLYFFEDAESARRAGLRWDGNFRDEHLAEIELIEQNNVSRYDSEWITHHMASADRSWILDYLSGKLLGPEPLWELLVEGRGFVLGTELRQHAYEVVKHEWPRSLALLEISRLAVELRSDLGLIVPRLTVQGNVARVDAYMNMEDAENPEFLGRLRNYVINREGPMNAADLSQMSEEMRVPDLRGHSVEFAL